MGAEVFANDGATGTLSTSYTSGNTSIVLTTGHGARFPALLAGQTMRVRVYDPAAAIVAGTPPGGEIAVVTAHTAGSDTFTVARGEESTAIAWSAGWIFEAVLTANAQSRYVPNYCWQPWHNNMLAGNYDPGGLLNATTPGAGVEFYNKIWLPETTYTFTTLWIAIATAGTGATSLANCFVGLRNSAGVLIGTCPEQHTSWATTGPKSAALTVVGGQSLTMAGGPGVYCWVVFLVGTQSTVNVQMGRYGNTTGVTTLNQSSNADYKHGTLGSGLSALPATPTISALQAGANAFGAWIS